MWDGFVSFYNCFTRTARMMVGIPDYEMYRRHLEACHPSRVPMSYGEFFRERQESRFGGRGKVGRCC